MGKNTKLMQKQTRAIADQVQLEISNLISECARELSDKSNLPAHDRDKDFVMKYYENKKRADALNTAKNIVEFSLSENTASTKIKPSGYYAKQPIQKQTIDLVKTANNRLDTLIKFYANESNFTHDELFNRMDRAYMDTLIEVKQVIAKTVENLTINHE